MQTALAALGPCPPEIFITTELDRRPARRTDYLAEKRAIQDLAGRLIDHPGEVLPRFVELAMLLTGGVSAGLSLFEPEPDPASCEMTPLPIWMAYTKLSSSTSS